MSPLSVESKNSKNMESKSCAYVETKSQESKITESKIIESSQKDSINIDSNLKNSPDSKDSKSTTDSINTKTPKARLKKTFLNIIRILNSLELKYDHYIHILSKYYHDFTDKDKIFLYVASLSFYTIFSIIPLLLMLFSIISSFPSFIEHIESFKQSILSNILPNNTKDISNMFDNFLTNGKELGFIGFLIALISSFVFFRNFDDISARIFSAKKRSYFDSFIIYWLLITLIPLFVVTSVYFSTIISTKYSSVFSHLYTYTPLLTTWLSFAILFRVAANKSLRLSVLLSTSLFGALAWYCSKSIFFYYMSYNKFYSNIYGSMSIIMFLFLWIYISWFVVLISMRICKFLDDKFPDV